MRVHVRATMCTCMQALLLLQLAARRWLQSTSHNPVAATQHCNVNGQHMADGDSSHHAMFDSPHERSNGKSHARHAQHDRMTPREHPRQNAAWWMHTAVVVAIGGLLLTAYGAKTVVRTWDWKDDQHLFEAAIKACPLSPDCWSGNPCKGYVYFVDLWCLWFCLALH